MVFNSMNFDRFEGLRVSYGDDLVDGNLLISALGFATFSKTQLE